MTRPPRTFDRRTLKPWTPERIHESIEKGPPGTPAQQAARDRNWRICRLRSLATSQWLLTGDRRERFLALVDEELKALGALTIAEHYEAVQREWARREKERTECQIPF